MQSGDTDALRAARAKAAEVRELMKTMSPDERTAHKQAKADERKEKARARYAAQKAEKLRLKEAADELARMKANPVGEASPPGLPKFKEKIAQPETVEAEYEPVGDVESEIAQAPEQEPEPPSEPAIEQVPEPPPEPAFEAAEPEERESPPPPPPKPAKKKKKVVLELDSDSEDEVVSVKVPRKTAQLPASHRPMYNDWRPRGQAGLTETRMTWPSSWQF